jgi:hypothetical protein
MPSVATPVAPTRKHPDHHRASTVPRQDFPEMAGYISRDAEFLSKAVRIPPNLLIF